MILRFPKNKIGITQPFIPGKHSGLDLGWFDADDKANAEVLAPADGVVVSVRKNYNTQDSSGSSYGNFVKVDHGNGIMTLSAHMKYNTVCVNVGDKVKQGQKLGIIGTTGHSTGVHIHYEVWENGIRKDPLIYTYVYPDQIVGEGTKRDYNLKYYNPSPEPPAPPSEDFKVGDKVIPTRLVNYNGTPVKQYDEYYYITELVNDLPCATRHRRSALPERPG